MVARAPKCVKETEISPRSNYSRVPARYNLVHASRDFAAARNQRRRPRRDQDGRSEIVVSVAEVSRRANLRAEWQRRILHGQHGLEIARHENSDSDREAL